jgi:hypothetical protein
MANLYTEDTPAHTTAITGDLLVKTGPGVYCGLTVTTTTAVGIIEIRDATAAGQGVVIDVIPIGTAAGVHKPRKVKIKRGLFVDFAASATGAVVVEVL